METFNSMQKTFELGKKEYLFVKLIKPRTILCWVNDGIYEGMRKQTCTGIDVSRLDVDTLKSFGIWSQLPENVCKDLENGIMSEKNSILAHMDKMRRGRRNKFAAMGIPKEIVCCKCGEPYKIVPSLFLKKYDKVKLEKTLEEYIKVWECKVCSPRQRGKRANPATAHFPKELECGKCHKKMVITPSGIMQRAKGQKKTPEDFLKAYLCQVCNPTRGRHLRGKKGKGGKK